MVAEHKWELIAPRTYRCKLCGRVVGLPPGRTIDGLKALPCNPLPPLREAVPRYLTALARWVAAGRPVRTDAEVERIFAICQQCEHYAAEVNRCRLCGCRLIGPAIQSKIKMATEHCPVGRW